MNTHATMLLYVCIMTVLLCCCLGRCLIVPLSQASNYEINSRKHFSKLDKNALLQQEIIQWVHEQVITTSCKKYELKRMMQVRM